MAHVKELLVEQLQDLLHAEGQLTEALPKMAEAANHPKLKEAFEKHLIQTQGQIERIRTVFDLLGESSTQGKPCKAMMGLIKEGQETIEAGSDKDPLAADLALIAAAQKVEHYEIASYGTVRVLAKQLGQVEAARLLTHTLGEEESADFLLTEISNPLLQQATLDDLDAHVNLEANGASSSAATPEASKKSHTGKGRSTVKVQTSESGLAEKQR